MKTLFRLVLIPINAFFDYFENNVHYQKISRDFERNETIIKVMALAAFFVTAMIVVAAGLGFYQELL